MSALLDLDSLPFIFRSKRTLFGAQPPPPSSASVTFSPAPVALLCSCAASLHPPSSSLSLNISIWLCQLHFHLHFLHPLRPHPSPILFIYAKVAADAALSSEVYVPLWWLSGPYGVVFHGRHVGHRSYCIRAADRKHNNLHEYFTMCCTSHVVFHKSKTSELCSFMNKTMFSFHELRVENGPVNSKGDIL